MLNYFKDNNYFLKNLLASNCFIYIYYLKYVN